MNKVSNLSIEERNKKYNEYVLAKIPKTKSWPTLFYSFLVGGMICMLGQGITDLLMVIFKTMSVEIASGWTSIILIFLTSLLTGFGIFDRIGVFAGAGTIVPITGFANSITSPAIEFKKEGIIFGVCAKMFTVAGPVIVTGVIVSIIIGLFYLIF